MRVKSGKNLSDEYKADVSAVMPDGDHEEIVGGTGGSTAVFGGGGNDDDWDGGESFEDDADSDAAEEARREELNAMSAADLKGIAKSLNLDIKGKKKADVIDIIITAEASDGEGDDDMVDDDDMTDDDDDEVMEVSEESLKAMDVETLKSTAAQVGVEVKGKKKSEVIAAILAAAEGDDGDDEDPF